MRCGQRTPWMLAVTLALLYTFGQPSIVEPQQQLKHVGEYDYGLWQDGWYRTMNGHQGNRLDLSLLVVRLKGRAQVEDYDFEGLGLPRLEIYKGRRVDGFYTLRVPKDQDPFAIAQELYESGDFEYVLFNEYRPLHSSPNDPLYQNQWNCGVVDMPGAWNLTTGSSDVVLAIFDTGFDYYHEDLAANIWSGIGYDFYDDDDDPYPYDGSVHGTWCAGVAAAVSNNSKGVAGAAGGWAPIDGVQIMVMDVGEDALGVSISAFVEAADSAVAWGADVFSMSFGGWPAHPLEEAAINRAVNEHGVVAVASAGNLGGETSYNRRLTWPARYRNVIAVGGSDHDDDWWSDPVYTWLASSLGNAPAESLDVLAPAEKPILTTDITGEPGYPGNYTDQFWQTSSACPLVAGIASLMLSVNPSLSCEEVRSILRDTAYKVPQMQDSLYTDRHGFGRVDALAALVKVIYDAQLWRTSEVTSDTTWPTSPSFSNVYVAGDIMVSSAATLTIVPGTTVYFDPGGDYTGGGAYPGLSELDIEGRLVADAEYDEIVFRSAVDDAEPGTWGGIIVGPSRSSVFRNCFFWDAVTAVFICTSIYSPEPTRIEWCGFTNSEMQHVYGYELYGPASATIESTIFDVNCPYGMYFWGRADSVRVKDCVFFGSADASYGIYTEAVLPGFMDEHGPNLVDTHFEDFTEGTAIRLSERRKMSIEMGSISNCKWGMTCGDTRATLFNSEPEGVSLSACTVGIYTDSGSDLEIVGGCLIESCNIGIETRDSSEPRITNESTVSDCMRGLYAKDTSAPYLRNVTFSNCTLYAAEVAWQAVPDLGAMPDPGFNSFHSTVACGTYKHVKAKNRDFEVGPVMAEGNWWGAAPPNPGCFSAGTVDYSPWLTSDPNDAAPREAVQIVLEGIPASAGLSYPNPFSSTASIHYSVPEPGARAMLQVFDVKGRLVRTLVNRAENMGRYIATWDGRDDQGKAVASGVYFCTIEIGHGFRQTRKMILVR